MIKLLYLSNLRLPTEKAYGIQIAKMCEAFAKQAEVELAYPSRKNPIGSDVFDYYSVNRIFKFKKLPAPDIYFSGALDKIAVGLKNFISALILAAYALSRETEVIYSRDELVLYLLSFLKKTLVFEAHRFSLKRARFYNRFKNKGIKLVAISEAIKKDFVEAGFKSDKILVAHDGVDLELFDVDVKKDEARHRLNIPRNAKIVMYTGHLFEWKGADVLLETARHYQLSTINYQLLFVFVGGMEHDIEKFKQKAKGLNNVLILGHKPNKEIPLFLKAADVLVLPNSASDKISSYTSPLKLFEYMSSKRPIVASKLPSITEILNDRNSVLVKPDDSYELAEGLKKVLEDEKSSYGLASRAFEDVQQYTWQKRAEKIINFIG